MSEEVFMNITLEDIKKKEVIETIAKDVLKKLNIKEEYDEYLSVVMEGISKGIKSFDSSKGVKLSTHLYNIAKYSVLDHKKKKNKNTYRFRLVEDLNNPVSDNNLSVDIISRIDKSFNSKIMNRAIDLLNNDEKDILKKKFWYNRSYSQIASDYDKSKQAIQQSLKKALKKIRDFLIKENFTDFRGFFSLEESMSKLTNREIKENVVKLSENIEKDVFDFKSYIKLKEVYKEAIDFESYLNLQKKIISVFEDKAEELNEQEVFTMLADAFAVAQEYEKSLKFDKKALNLNPDDSELLKNVGLSEYLLGNFHNASEFLEEAVENNSKDIQVYNYLIESLIKLNKTDKVLKYYKKFINVFEDVYEELNSAEAFTLLADAYSVIKEYDKSLMFDKKALEIEPDNIEFLKNTGLSHFLLKDFEKSYEIFKQVLQKNPEDEESKKYLKKSKELIKK